MANQTRATTNQITHNGVILSESLDEAKTSLELKDESGNIWVITVSTLGVLVVTPSN